MRLQDKQIEDTKIIAEEAFRYSKKVPADRLDWKPMDQGRSVIDLCREMAQCADWTYDLLSTGAMDMSEDAFARGKAESEGWTTPEACETAANAKLERLYAIMRDYPDEKLTDTTVLPFGPEGTERPFTMAEIMDYPRWNMTYHLGQIGYIQTLYGDRDMH